MSIHFLDTSAVLNGALKEYEPTACISTTVLSELENIKTGNKNDEIKYLAREAVRDIMFNNKIKTYIAPEKKVLKYIQKNPYLKEIPDHHILVESLLYSKEVNDEMVFITSDATLYLIARTLPIAVSYYLSTEKKPIQEEYNGWSKFKPTEEELISLYSNPTKNILKANINEYCEIYEGEELKDILRWTGEKYTTLKYNNFKNSFLNKKIQPLNLEQKMAFDLLQNREIPVKILLGNPGVGKDFIMLLHALDLVQKGIMEKIIFIRNLVPFKDAPEIGFLAGDLQQKIAWGLGPISSILGEEGLNQYIESGIIETVNLGFIRGCSWDNTILYVSEGQNITGGGYKLLVSRCGINSELWVNGDIIQTDKKEFEKNNGLLRLSNSLKNNSLAGTVKLIKTERSAVADLAKII